MKRLVFILFLILLLSFTFVPLSNAWVAMSVALKLPDPMSQLGFGMVGVYWGYVAGLASGLAGAIVAA
ncbi:MAG: hypothetical protein H0Z29_08380 [Candidatus Marinimicrobia bacterium]|nr:hypothetical protein [Candidatus Neomarinimicrobiota bacterium]